MTILKLGSTYNLKTRLKYRYAVTVVDVAVVVVIVKSFL